MSGLSATYWVFIVVGVSTLVFIMPLLVKNRTADAEENLMLMRLMDERQLDYPTHGVLQIQDYLRDEGYTVNYKRVRRLLRLMGLRAIYPQKNLSKLGLAKYIYPYLLRNLKIDKPNQVWEIDITYIPMEKGFMYLTAIIDVHSRYVVNWGLSNSLEAQASLSVLQEAIEKHGKPEIINSDQGSHRGPANLLVKNGWSI